MNGSPANPRARSPVSFNMTPMIDVVFMLIIFFMLVSNFASVENLELDLPDPDHSQAAKVKLTRVPAPTDKRFWLKK